MHCNHCIASSNLLGHASDSFCSASIMWYVDNLSAEFDEQSNVWTYTNDSAVRPKSRGQVAFFQSIPDTMWWSIVTATTVGCAAKFCLVVLAGMRDDGEVAAVAV
jgi:hypothetical protein